MKIMYFRCLFVIILLVLPLNNSPAEQSIRTAGITIDISKNTGAVPYLFRGGVFNGNVIPKGYMLEKYLSDIKPGAFEFYLAHTTIRPSKNLQDLEQRLSEWDDVAKRIAEKGGEIVVAIDAMPSWLTSNPSKKPVNPAIGDHTPIGNLSPPKDYDKWAELVEVIVRHFNHKLGIKAKYIVWGEPDIVWWQGTKEEFFKLYRYSVLGAKRADKDAKIGGPAVSEWDGKKTGDDRPLIYDFIKYAGSTPLPELGMKKLPVDFINWHQFNANPVDPLSYSEPAEAIRGWLKEYGYKKDTEFLIGEWIIWQYFGKEHGFSNEEHDNEINASYIVSSLIAMDDAGIQRHSYAYLIDSVQGKEFVGDFGLFTKHGIIKASFNAFKTLSMLEGKRVSINNTDPTIRAVSTNHNGQISVLISNFIPYDRMLKQTASRELREKGHTKHEIKQYNIDRKTIQGVMDGKIKVDSLNIPAKTKDDVKEVLRRMKKFQSMKKEQVSLTMNFLNNKPQKYKYEEYLIDSTHSNSYAASRSLSAAVKRNPRSINEMKGVKLEKVENRVIDNLGVLSPLQIDPYSVTLIVLTPL